ncbi:hypothetical protein PE36_08146 [Moritella sp. PE36]|nr:hypothetical protein PE36_08146 [Moritella sp. PE36]
MGKRHIYWYLLVFIGNCLYCLVIVSYIYSDQPNRLLRKEKPIAWLSTNRDQPNRLLRKGLDVSIHIKQQAQPKRLNEINKVPVRAGTFLYLIFAELSLIGLNLANTILIALVDKIGASG